MHLSMWTYPWDLQDQGLERAVSELRDQAGLNTISLATSYHAGRFLQPRSPQQKAYFPEDGTVYYRPQDETWAGREIRPLMAANVAERGDMLAALLAARAEGGMKVSCWTVCLHNTRLGMLHPAHVTRNAFGNANYYNLCPSSPAARDYVVTMVGEITRLYKPDMLELESPNFMGFAHEFHHEKDGVGLLPEDDFLLSLCFCDHCMARAKAAGVDADSARSATRRFIAEMCDREVPQAQIPGFPAEGIDAFAAWPALHAYLLWRTEPVTSLVAEIRAQADPATKIVLIDLKDGWLGGVDLAAVGQHCDGAILCCYFMEPDAISALIEAGRAALGPEKFLGAGYRVFYPEVLSAEALAARARAAVDAGADGINFYNYGLIPAPRLGWVRKAVDGLIS
ncbi:hypothetical protein BJF93_19830 [Xaviernesmea oryzae]|uniref:Uncharacterized protein n=1 Tax=Xaviernesmea oryzae TaxID=464029 RepID=A0A1Q9AYP6_9HYPH|nr:hypothetical protein [Xaviernesmea oryzae]OLP60576.1 hypothetical protein BJF93_19830 [Xaviernesmea oryzae]SEM31524.1 hypothetical protein SAMN04487976_12820 [Xaviernesmea oryzae]